MNRIQVTSICMLARALHFKYFINIVSWRKKGMKNVSQKRLFREYWLFLARVYMLVTAINMRHGFVKKTAWFRLNCDFIQQDMFYEKNTACWEPVRRSKYGVQENDSVTNNLHYVYFVGKEYSLVTTSLRQNNMVFLFCFVLFCFVFFFLVFFSYFLFFSQ